MHYFANPTAKSVRQPRGVRGLMGVNMANLADWAKRIDFAAARAYNARSSRDNGWTIHPGVGVDPGSDDFVMYVAAFQHGAGLTVDGQLGPRTIAKVQSGIIVPFDNGTLGKTVVFGGIDTAFAGRYNQQSAVAHGWTTIAGKAYTSPADPKLAQDVAAVQRANNIRVTGTLDEPTRALFIRLINECARPGQLISDSLRFPGASCGTPLPRDEPAVKPKKEKTPVKKEVAPRRDEAPPAREKADTPPAAKKSSAGLVVGIMAAAAGAYYLTQG
jgi:hypothetical protein